MKSLQDLNKPATSEMVFIDKFFVPSGSRTEFEERMNINRNFIHALPGFIQDEVYLRKDENGNFHFITTAVWENEESISQAKEAVQAEYKREGFDMQGMLKRLYITIERGVYQRMAD